jgi:hypothetical protein
MIFMMMTIPIPAVNPDVSLRSPSPRPSPPGRGGNFVALSGSPITLDSIQCLNFPDLKTRNLCHVRRSTFDVQRSMFS